MSDTTNAVDPWFQPHEIPVRIARTRADVRRLLAAVAAHDLADPLRCDISGEAIAHLEEHVCEVPEIPEITARPGRARWLLADALAHLPDDLAEAVARTALHLLPPEAVARASAPPVPRVEPAPVPRDVSIAELLRARLVAIGMDASALVSELRRVGCRASGEEVTGWLDGSAIPAPTDVDALGDVFVLSREVRRAWDTAATAARAPRYEAAVDAWAAWLHEHGEALDTAEVPMPPAALDRELYLVGGRDGEALGCGLTPEDAWTGALALARDGLRMMDTFDEPGPDAGSAIASWLDGAAVVRVVGPGRIVDSLAKAVLPTSAVLPGGAS